MSKNQFLAYLREDLLFDDDAMRLVQNILTYAESQFCGEDEVFLFLSQMLDGVAGLTEDAIKCIRL